MGSDLGSLHIIFGEKSKFLDLLKLKFFRKVRINRACHVAAVDVPGPNIDERLWDSHFLAIGRKSMAQIVEVVRGEIPFEYVGHDLVIGGKLFLGERQILSQLRCDRDLTIGLLFSFSAFTVRNSHEVFIEGCAVQFISAYPRVEEEYKLLAVVGSFTLLDKCNDFLPGKSCPILLPVLWDLYKFHGILFYDPFSQCRAEDLFQKDLDAFGSPFLRQSFPSPARGSRSKVLGISSA